MEISTAASATLIPTIRAVASDLAARADFDLDSIADLRMAVDEACATLVDVAAPASRLRCTFLVQHERIEVLVQVEPSHPDAMLSTESFGWRVLQTLADKVAVERSSGAPGDGGPMLGIRLGKFSGDPAR